jgi:putative Mn2+ efflux pump MntP
MLRLLLFVLPLGIDTLGVSISLGIQSVECGDPAWGAGNIQHVQHHDKSGGMYSINRHPNCLGGSWSKVCRGRFIVPTADLSAPGNAFPPWLGSALLFSLAETVMPLVGLALGFTVSLLLSSVMHILGPLLLIGVGLWELLQEVHERTNNRKKHQNLAADDRNVVAGLAPARSIRWDRQLLLALSVSVDELAIGFSLGAITSGTLSGGQVIPGSQTINTITLCILIGLQGFLMTLIGLTLGRTLRVRLKFVKQWTELLSCFLLVALGVWLLIT